MKLFLLALLVLPLLSQAQLKQTPSALLHSSARGPQESAQSAYQRYRLRLIEQRTQVPRDTPVDQAKPLDKLTFEKVPVYQNNAAAIAAFSKFRDARFIQDSSHQMMRRSSWLFPDDGCFARAALAIQNLKLWNLVVPAKLFIFGNLTVKTTNSPAGSVSWWYHVVPIVTVGQQPVILDPAINPKQPMFLKDWILTMTNDVKAVTLSICHPSTYAPSSPCSLDSTSSASALEDQKFYLNEEWIRLTQLNRDPSKELGDFPPWLVNFHH